jgi:flagellum-specific peptidoglycan hydrolase FlgJ
MKKNTFLILLFFAITANSQGYVAKYKALTLKLAAEYQIPPEIIMGIAILESGAGKSKVAVRLNNHFGFVGKNNANYKTRYKQYANVEESYKHFCKKISEKKFYKGMKGNKNLTLWIDKISKTGYSVYPKLWRQKVAASIKKNNLKTVFKTP